MKKDNDLIAFSDRGDCEWTPLVRFGPYVFDQTLSIEARATLLVKSRTTLPGESALTFATVCRGVSVTVERSILTMVYVAEGPFMFGGRDWMGSPVEYLIEVLGGIWNVEENDGAWESPTSYYFDDYGLIADVTHEGLIDYCAVGSDWRE